MNAKSLLIIATATLVAFTSAPSFALSCLTKRYNQFVVDDGTVPVNVGGIPWLSSLEVQPKITITNGDGVEVEITITRDSGVPIIRPADWALGNTYHIVLKVVSEQNNSTYDSTNDPMSLELRDLEQTIHVVAPLALAMPLSLDVSPLETGITYTGYFEPRNSVWVNIQAKFAEPPSNFYMFKTLMDGAAYNFLNGCESSRAWPGRTIYGPGADRLVVQCGARAGSLAPGVHQLRLEVRIMGTFIKDLTPPLEVDIPCAQSGIPDTKPPAVVPLVQPQRGGSSGQSPDSGCSSVESNGSVFLVLLGFLMFRRRHLVLEGNEDITGSDSYF